MLHLHFSINGYLLLIITHILAEHIQLVHNFVEQMASNTPFFFIPFENGIN